MLFRPLSNQAFGQRITTPEVAEQIDGGRAMPSWAVNDDIPRRIGGWFTEEIIANPPSYTARSDANFRLDYSPRGVVFLCNDQELKSQWHRFEAGRAE